MLGKHNFRTLVETLFFDNIDPPLLLLSCNIH